MHITGLLVFKIDVGAMPSANVDDYIKKQKDGMSELVGKLKSQGTESVFIPTRSGSSDVEYISINNAHWELTHFGIDRNAECSGCNGGCDGCDGSGCDCCDCGE